MPARPTKSFQFSARAPRLRRSRLPWYLLSSRTQLRSKSQSYLEVCFSKSQTPKSKSQGKTKFQSSKGGKDLTADYAADPDKKSFSYESSAARRSLALPKCLRKLHW